MGRDYAKMDYTDFESSNIEYIQFWLMDPFLDENQTNHNGGELYFNLGEVSEDILKDGMKSFENGLPVDGDTTQIATTVWGKVSKRQSLTYAFDNTSGARALQDVGLDGLSNDEEYGFPSYRDYLDKLETKLSPAVVEAMRQDQFSPFNDPAGDNYHFIVDTIMTMPKLLYWIGINDITEQKTIPGLPRK